MAQDANWLRRRAKYVIRADVAERLESIANRFDFLVERNLQLEVYVAREAKVIAALKNETDAANRRADAAEQKLADLTSAGHVKDDADVAAEQAEATRLKLDANGDPVVGADTSAT